MFAVAGLTDLLDGLIARTFSRRTSLGAWLDPMADKLLIVATVSVLTLPGLGLVNKLPVWLTILIITRDLLIVADGRGDQPRDRPPGIPPSIYGKMATATYIITCVVIMYFNYLQRPSMLVTRGHLRLRRNYAGLRVSLRVQYYEDHQSELIVVGSWS